MTRFGAGIRESLPEVLAGLDPSGVFGVVDEAVGRRFGTPSGLDGSMITVEGGESCKDITHWSGLLDRFIKAELDRHAVVVAVGGGTVLDLAGFAAAAYLRGVRWIAVPTTLLAQVDASHGGKTGIDHPAAKNLVGAFHAPSEVLVDTDYLVSLPKREVRGGLAEVIKHAVIARPDLLERVGRDDPARFLEPAAQVKLEIVARDPLEKDERRLLNLGHTLGHALEQASYYQLHHGEAVALGLRAAGILAERHCGFADRAVVEEALDRCGLPSTTDLPEWQVLAALRHDKKRREGTLRWILPVALGDVRVFDDVPDELVSEALSGIRAAS
jgi:3-dehydroquinate synthetase